MRKAIAMLLVVAAGTVLFQNPALAVDSNQNQSQNQDQKAAPTEQPKTHTVTAGESLSSIATDNQMDSWRPLWNANTQLTNPDLLNVGDQLQVPSGQTTDRPLPDGYGQVAAAPVSEPVSHVSYTRSNVRPANYAAGSGDVFARIRARESGGNYAENTGNGYYGAYQFDIGTWGGYGGYARADLAPPSVQDAKAAETYARRGCSPWPNTCY